MMMLLLLRMHPVLSHAATGAAAASATAGGPAAAEGIQIARPPTIVLRDHRHMYARPAATSTTAAGARDGGATAQAGTLSNAIDHDPQLRGLQTPAIDVAPRSDWLSVKMFGARGDNRCRGSAQRSFIYTRGSALFLAFSLPHCLAASLSA